MKPDDIISNSPNIKIKEIPSNDNDKQNILKNNIDSFKVYIRIKPSVHKEINIINSNIMTNSYNNISKSIPQLKDNLKNILQEKEKIQMIKVEKNILYLNDIKNQKGCKTFLFDGIFPELSNNKNIFCEAIKPMIDKILMGYNSTALAYGVTGTGKTYTIFGDLTSNFGEEGIIFKACDYLFEKIKINKKVENKNNNNVNYYIKFSYFEIYNEIVKDLISENSSHLILVEDSQKGVICSNAKEIIINDSIELRKIINESNKRRTMASTNKNQFSSRSHAILQMTLEKRIQKKNSENNYEFYFSKFLFVDLAGSEKGSEKGKRREEGVNINKSLFTLSSCLNILSEKSNTGKFIPYRDSKLTRLLKDSLGGNILTVMLACISSCSSNYDETLSTLNYAAKAKKITKKVMKNIKEININNLQYKEMIDSLKNEIFQLKTIIKNQEIKLKEKAPTSREKEEINNKVLNISNEIRNNNIIKNKKNNFDNDIKTNIKILNFKKYNKRNKEKDILEKSDINFSTNEYENSINTKDYAENTEFSENLDNKINIDNYNNYIEEIPYDNLNINELINQIESIKKDKSILENYLLKDNMKSYKNINIKNKYNSIKIVYNKFIELINEKLMENLEQNMIYNFNIKEIGELNQLNNDKILELEKLSKEEKIMEEINYTKKNIEDNIIQKNLIIESIKKNEHQKEELQKLLLNLFSNKSDSLNQYINVLKEKDKLFKITKQYKKEIENYVKIQKKKDEDINKINKKLQILKKKLKEKDKKINELEKLGEKNKYNNKTSNIFNKSKISGNIKTETRFISENNKSPITYHYCADTFKRNDSKINKTTKEIFHKSKIKIQNQKKGGYMHIRLINEKRINNNNQSINSNNNKRYTSISKVTNNKSIKNFKKINKLNYKTENNNENINNIYAQKKFINITIPTTTITLSEINNKKTQIKQLINNNKDKSTDKLNDNVKKYSSKIIQKSKKDLNKSFSPKKFLKRINKSITANLKRNYSPEVVSNQINKTNNFNNENNENDLWSLNSFKIYKLKSKKENLNDNKIIFDLNQNLNKVKIKKMKTNKIINIIKKNAINDNSKNIIISKSNPRLLIDNKISKIFIKRLSLKEARYENKLKYEKYSNRRNDLNVAESFINEYKKMNIKDSIQVHHHSFKNIKNHYISTLILNKIDEENANKIYFTDNQKIINESNINETNKFKQINNLKEKVFNPHDKNSIKKIYSIYANIKDKKCIKKI